MLHGRVAVVTGASRGVGKGGIAGALGEAGAIVYVTGRSQGGRTTESMPGTVQETAESVTRRGGEGVAAVCDHTVDAEVEALFTRVREEQGRLDLLVNNVWGGYEQFDWSRFAAPFWDQPSRHWSRMFEAGVRAHLIATQRAVPLMLAAFTAAGRVLGNLESPEYIGRAVVALAADPGIMAKSGRVLTVGKLAAEYGFTDVDGSRWPPFLIET